MIPDPNEPLLPPEPPIASTEAPASTPSKPPRHPWVPVRLLTSRHRARVLAHLLALDDADRYLRFGIAAPDAQISRYVDSLDFERDELFGIFNRHLDLIAVAHLAFPSAAPSGAAAAMAEFGVSVSRAARGRGFGARLFDFAVIHARNRGIRTLLVHALSENKAMLAIARNAGATLRRDGADSEAVLELPPDDLASRVGALVEDQAAELDYRFKERARRVQRVLCAVTEASTQIAAAIRAKDE